MGNIQFENKNPSKDIEMWIKIANKVLGELDGCTIEGIDELKKILQKALNGVQELNLDKYLMDERVKDRIMNIFIAVKNIEDKLKDYIDTSLNTIREKINAIRRYNKDTAKSLEVILGIIKTIANRQDLQDKDIVGLANRVYRFLVQVEKIERIYISKSENAEQMEP